MRRALALLAAACLLAVPAGGAAAQATPAPVPVRVFRFVDQSRIVHFRNGTRGPRTLVTYVRTPAGAGPFPLLVFAHGYRATPGIYARLLDAWASAGYVVAAPVFPLESRDAPGGTDEYDLVNEPADISFVISRLLELDADPASPLHGLVDPTRVAVAGQSDGAEAALGVAYDSRFRDSRIRAAVILSGSLFGGRPKRFGRGSAPLLAVQGTADRINRPRATTIYFGLASRPKFLLALLGGAHLAPYTTNGRELGVVESVSIAFLDHYLGGGSLSQLLRAGDAPGIARLTADP